MINIILALWLAYNKYIRGKRDGRILSGQSKHIFLKIQSVRKYVMKYESLFSSLRSSRSSLVTVNCIYSEKEECPYHWMYAHSFLFTQKQSFYKQLYSLLLLQSRGSQLTPWGLFSFMASHYSPPPCFPAIIHPVARTQWPVKYNSANQWLCIQK